MNSVYIYRRKFLDSYKTSRITWNLWQVLQLFICMHARNNQISLLFFSLVMCSVDRLMRCWCRSKMIAWVRIIGARRLKAYWAPCRKSGLLCWWTWERRSPIGVLMRRCRQVSGWGLLWPCWALECFNTMWCRHIAVSFLPNPHKRHPTAWPLRQDKGVFSVSCSE